MQIPSVVFDISINGVFCLFITNDIHLPGGGSLVALVDSLPTVEIDSKSFLGNKSPSWKCYTEKNTLKRAIYLSCNDLMFQW